jgi:hypothetical protein
MPFGPLDPSGAVVAPALTIGAPRIGYGYSLAAMRTELQQRLLGRIDIEPTRLNLWINDAYLDMMTSVDPLILDSSYSFPLSPDNPLYLLPEQVHFIHSMAVVSEDWIFGGRPLIQTELHGYRMAADQSGWPIMWFPYGDAIGVWPTPDSALEVSVDFRVRPIQLTNDVHCPFIKREWHEGIILLARAKAFSALQEWEAAGLADNDYGRWLERRTDQRAAQDRNRIVRSAVPRSRNDLVRGRYRPFVEPGD